MISVRTPSGIKDVAAVSIRTAAGLKDIASMSLRSASGLSQFYGGAAGSFTVTATPTLVYGAAAFAGTTAVATSSCVIGVTGGVAPYTYSWVDLDGLDWSIVVIGPGEARFQCPSLGPGDSSTNTFKCTVTDARGRSVDSPVISASAVNYGGGF